MSSQASSPEVPSESRGSSVSTGLREEYEDLLRYAVVTPVCPVDKTRKYPSALSPAYPTPRPQSPPQPATGVLHQPQVSKLSSDVSDPGSLEGVDTKPPPPHTAMSVQQAVRGMSHDMVMSLDSTLLHNESGESHDLDDSVVLRSHDPETSRLEAQLDGWCADLKRNILAEFDQSRLHLLERREAELNKERQQNESSLTNLRTQLEQHKELLATYEASIARKDHIIANLTLALQKQKERVELQRSFGSWKLRHCDEKREAFTAVMADQLYRKKVKGQVWRAWFGILKAKWKQRVEKACQSKAEEVCVQLSGDYEQQLETAQQCLQESQAEVQRLQTQRDLYEENMKKAFMRGVCALNMEAMSMFRHSDVVEDCQSDQSSGQGEVESCQGSITPTVTASQKGISHKSLSKSVHVTTSTGHITGRPNQPKPSTSKVRQQRGNNCRNLSQQKPDIVVQKH